MTKFNSTADINAKTDEELVRIAQTGEVAAFNALYERYLNVVFRRVRYSIPQADVEDVTQEVFIAVIRSLKQFRGDSKFRTWLYTILSHKITDYYRSRDISDFQWKDIADDEIAESVHLAEQVPGATSFTTIDDVIIVRQALLRLPEHYREVILLRFVDDLPFAEIAIQQGQSLEAAKSLFRRAISALQQVLEEAHV